MLAKRFLVFFFSAIALFLVKLDFGVCENDNHVSSPVASKNVTVVNIPKVTVKLPLSSSLVSEGACVVDPPLTFLNPIMWLYPRKFYIPIASEYAFRRFAEIFLGRPAQSEQELEEMCLTLDLFGTSFKTNGYGEYLAQTCFSWAYIFSFNWSTMKCYPDTVSNDIVQKSYVDDYTDNLVLTDNETFGMFVRCINGVRDFKVLTTTREVNDELLAKIKDKATSLGFDSKLVRTLSCKRKETDRLQESRDEL